MTLVWFVLNTANYLCAFHLFVISTTNSVHTWPLNRQMLLNLQKGYESIVAIICGLSQIHTLKQHHHESFRKTPINYDYNCCTHNRRLVDKHSLFLITPQLFWWEYPVTKGRMSTLEKERTTLGRRWGNEIQETPTCKRTDKEREGERGKEPCHQQAPTDLPNR